MAGWVAHVLPFSEQVCRPSNQNGGSEMNAVTGSIKRVDHKGPGRQAEIDRLSAKIRNWRIVALVQLVGMIVLAVLK